MDKSKYLKDKQPPAIGDEEMLKVDVDVEITRILVIDEGQIFSKPVLLLVLFICR